MDDDSQDPLPMVTALAASSASLSAALTLQLWRNGLLSDDVRQEFEQKLRDMARDFEAAGCDAPASQCWTAAHLLRSPAPKGRG